MGSLPDCSTLTSCAACAGRASRHRGQVGGGRGGPGAPRCAPGALPERGRARVRALVRMAGRHDGAASRRLLFSMHLQSGLRLLALSMHHFSVAEQEVMHEEDARVAARLQPAHDTKRTCNALGCCVITGVSACQARERTWVHASQARRAAHAACWGCSTQTRACALACSSVRMLRESYVAARSQVGRDTECGGDC